jgi:2'-5' RNA ligase
MTREDHRAAWESAVVVRVPAFDEPIDSLRGRFVLPRKPNGIGPHITVMVPFLPHAELDDHGSLAALRDVCAAVEPFEVTFGRTARFPHVLYLAPEPAEPVIALSAALTERWPQLAPYAGKEKQLIPHLTVTTGRPPKVFHQVEEALRPILPVRVQISAAQLYRFDGQRWSEDAQLPFGRP